MIRTFSLQVQTEHRDRTFYAFADHRPPPVPQKRPTHSQARNSKAYQTAQSRKAKPVEAEQSSNPLVVQGRKRTALSQLRQQPHQKNQKNNRRRHQAGNESAATTPVLSDARTRSHFGASTQMFIEDGSASNLQQVQEEAITPTPLNQYRETGQSQAIDESIPQNQWPGSKRLKGQKTKISRQLTTDYQHEKELPLIVKEDGAARFYFKSRAARSSHVSEKPEHHADFAMGRSQGQPSGTLANSVEQLTKLQLESARDNFDQISELRRMETQLETMRFAKKTLTIGSETTHFQNHDYNERGQSRAEGLTTQAIVDKVDAIQLEPAMVPLNVILPGTVNSGFVTASLPSEELGVTQKRRKIRARSANNTRVRRSKQGREVLEQTLKQSVVIMNDKKMNVADGATAKGIVSLYNRGFVPKQTGKMSRYTAGANKCLYSVAERNIPTAFVWGLMQRESEPRMRDHHWESFGGEYTVERPQNPQKPSLVSDLDFDLRNEVKGQHYKQSFGGPDPAQKAGGTSNWPDSVDCNRLHANNSQTLMKRRLIESTDANLADFKSSQEKRVFGFSSMQPHPIAADGGVINYADNEGWHSPLDTLEQKTKFRGLVKKPEKGYFKLPSTSQILQATQTPKMTTSCQMSAEFGAANSTGQVNLTNADAQSREMTEDEHLMQPINLQEKILSLTDKPSKPASNDFALIIAEDTSLAKSRGNNSKKTSDQGSQRQSRVRLQTAKRRSMHSKPSIKEIEIRKSLKFGQVTYGMADEEKETSKSQSRTGRNVRLTLRNSHEALRGMSGQTNNYSSYLIERRLPKTNSTFQLTNKSNRGPNNQTSLSHLVATSLQTRPLIGSSQHIRQTAVDNRSCDRKNLSSGCSQPNKIHLEIGTMKNSEAQLTKAEAMNTIAIHKIKTAFLEVDANLTPKAVSQTSFERLDFAQKEVQPMKHVDSRLQSEEVLLSDAQLKRDTTLEKVTSQQSQLQLNVKEQRSSRNTTKGKSKKAHLSGYTSRTQQVDAQGNVKHVFMINHPSHNDFKLSGEQQASRSKNSKDKRRKRRTMRPSSSRLRKREYKFSLNHVGGNDDEVVTAKGGSTSRRSQYDLAGRRSSGANTFCADSFRKVAHTSNSQKSLAKNLAQSSSQRSLYKKLDSSTMLDAKAQLKNDLIFATQRKSSASAAKRDSAKRLEVKNADDKRGASKSGLSSDLNQLNRGRSFAQQINDFLQNEEVPATDLIRLNQQAIPTTSTLQKATPEVPSHLTLYNDPVAVKINEKDTNVKNFRVDGSIDHLNGEVSNPRLLSDNSVQQARTRSLLDHERGSTVGECVRYVSLNESGRNEGQMMVVTKIRSKVQSDYFSPSVDFKEASKVTYDFQDGLEIKLLSQDRLRDSQITDQQLREQHQETLNPHYLSSITKGSQMSRDQILNAINLRTSVMVTPDLAAESPINGPSVSAAIRARAPITQPMRPPAPVADANLGPCDEEATVALIVPHTPDWLKETFLTARERFNLSGTIKQNQRMLQQVQLKAKEFLPLNNNRLARQDRVLARKERSVVPMSIATIPEKTAFKKRLFREHLNPNLSVVGFQTHQVTAKQLKNHLSRTALLCRSQDCQNVGFTQENISSRSKHPVYVQSLQSQPRSRLLSTQRELIDKGLQNTQHEDLSSFSGRDHQMMLQSYEKGPQLDLLPVVGTNFAYYHDQNEQVFQHSKGASELRQNQDEGTRNMKNAILEGSQVLQRAGTYDNRTVKVHQRPVRQQQMERFINEQTTPQQVTEEATDYETSPFFKNRPLLVEQMSSLKIGKGTQVNLSSHTASRNTSSEHLQLNKDWQSASFQTNQVAGRIFVTTAGINCCNSTSPPPEPSKPFETSAKKI